MFGYSKKCDQCGKTIEGEGEERYFRTFCSKEHVALYFGAYIDGEWSDFRRPDVKPTIAQ